MMNRRNVYITGGTGYIGRRLIPILINRGHEVKALVRKGSESKVPAGCSIAVGNALDRSSFAYGVHPADTFIHLVGVAHPGPGKSKQFREIDLVSIRESVIAAKDAAVSHFIYLSVTQPADFLKAYVDVRVEGERLIRESGMNATFVRPWYVLGPGHRWPYLLLPAYWVMERIPATCEKATHYGLVTLQQMINTLIHAVENPPSGARVVDVKGIRSSSALSLI
ncbi:MAG: SDR family oxidoreductase [Bacteroidota bacterium]